MAVKAVAIAGNVLKALNVFWSQIHGNLYLNNVYIEASENKQILK